MRFAPGLNNINYGKVLLYLFAVAIYLPMIFTNVISILLFLYCVVRFKGVEIYKVFQRRFVFFFLLLYLILVLGFLYDISEVGVLKGLEKKLSFVILPISIGLIKINKEDIKLIFKLFFFTGVLVTTFAMLKVFLLSIDSFEFSNYVNHQLSGQIGLHATYLSMYLLLSLVYPFVLLKSFKNEVATVMIYVLSSLCIIYILLLGVRIIWFILLVLFFFGGIYLVIKARFLKKHFYIGVLFLVLIVSSFYAVTPLRERFKEAVNYNKEYSTDQVWGGRGIRAMIWESCLDLIEHKPVIGYGSSTAVQENLIQSYKENNFGPLLYMMEKNGKMFNPHNQFLSDVLRHGIILGIIYPFFLLYMLAKYKENRCKIGLAFIAIVFGTSLTETILELNKGIVFFAYFGSVIYFSFELRKVDKNLQPA